MLMMEPGKEIARLRKEKGLTLSARSLNALYSADIETVGELLLLSEKELSKIRRLGPACRREIKAKLAPYSPPRTDTTLKYGIITV